MLCTQQNNEDDLLHKTKQRRTHTGTDMPALDKASMPFQFMLTMLEDAETCWKMLEDHLDHSQLKQMNHTPVP